MREESLMELAVRLDKGQANLLDVREPEEFETGHLEGALNLPLSQLEESWQELDPDLEYDVICQAGVRSARACAFLESKGYRVINVIEGMAQVPEEWL